MNLKSRKKGITVAMAATMILIIALMTTTVTIAVTKTVKGSNLKAFATELSLVQTTIQEFSFSGSINEYLGDDVTLTITSAEQFNGETVESNTVLLHVLDLSKMGIEKSVYGIGKNGNTKDYYAVSLDTMKVYYIAGYDSGDKVYYTLTDELVQLLNGENKVAYTNNVIFKASTLEWTNKPITVKVLVPTRISTSTITVSTNNSQIAISSPVEKNEYNEYTVNTESIEGNYIVTVKYIIDNNEITETYSVKNFDNQAPTIFMGNMSNSNNTYYLNDIRALDNGGVKNIKYVEIDIAENDAKSFFKSGGNELSGGKVKLSSENAMFTIYAEDYAGNFTTNVVTIPDKFYYVGGTKDTGLVISDNVADENKGVEYTCVGNQFVWVPVDDYSKFVRGTAEETSSGSSIYKMTGSVSSDYTEPYASGYATEQAEYNTMCASVEKYGGFYIARFEAGDGDATYGTNDVAIEKRTAATAAHTVVSKKGTFVYNYVPWGESMSSIGTTGAVYLSQNMYKNHESVVSTLCYGVQWDAVMNFVSDAEHSIVSSVLWGNYNDSTGTTLANSESGNMNYTTGRNEAWKAKNIYDLAGNISEWTMEKYSSDKRVSRGGYYGSSSSDNQASRRDYSDPLSDSSNIGFRTTLYLKIV